MHCATIYPRVRENLPDAHIPSHTSCCMGAAKKCCVQRPLSSYIVVAVNTASLSVSLARFWRKLMPARRKWIVAARVSRRQQLRKCGSVGMRVCMTMTESDRGQQHRPVSRQCGRGGSPYAVCACAPAYASLYSVKREYGSHSVTCMQISYVETHH